MTEKNLSDRTSPGIEPNTSHPEALTVATAETGAPDPSVILLHNVDPAWPSAEKEHVRDAVRQMVCALSNQGHRVVEAQVSDTDLANVLAPFDPAEHIVFNWCEEFPGMHRSDALVTDILEQLGYVYTGSHSDVLNLTWDKSIVRAMLTDHGVPVPYGQIVDSESVEDWQRFPAIVKPVREHCSNGIDCNAVVMDQKALQQRVAFVRKTFAQPALVEDFIDGREFHVTLWGNGQINMLPPAEMDFSAFEDVRERLCTFDSKFTPGSRHYEGIELRVPARLTAVETAALRQTATTAYQQMGCRDYARIDLRLQDDLFYVLDVNPNADISPDTSLAYAAEAAGIGYDGFVSRLVQLAAARKAQHQRMETTS